MVLTYSIGNVTQKRKADNFYIDLSFDVANSDHLKIC